MTSIKFIRVTGIRGKDPCVIATVGTAFVKWNPRRDWDCNCLTPEDEYECHHIEAVRDLLDDRVTTPLTTGRPAT